MHSNVQMLGRYSRYSLPTIDASPDVSAGDKGLRCARARNLRVVPSCYPDMYERVGVVVPPQGHPARPVSVLALMNPFTTEFYRDLQCAEYAWFFSKTVRSSQRLRRR